MRWFLLLLLNCLALVAAPILVLLALPFANQYAKTSLPTWLSWLNTPDDPGPAQGMYEPQVRGIATRFGWKAKTWYWLGIRNQLDGLFCALAPMAGQNCRAVFSGEYPQTKGPFTPGRCLVSMMVRGNLYREFCAVGAWSATKCWQIRIGYKLEEMSIPGPVMFVCQVKPYLTIDSTT